MNTKSAIVIGLSLIIATLILSFAILSEGNNKSENNRYKIYGRPPGYFIVLDTKTGACWAMNNDNEKDWNGKPMDLM